MKIGILTLPFNNNYGGLLQAYALQNYLQNRGHEVYSIQQSYTSCFEKIKEHVKFIFKIGDYTNTNNIVNFKHHFFKETHKIRKKNDLYRLKKYKFDAIVVGSDQVWRFEYIKEKYGMYFLDFVDSKKIKKISYAASFGVDYWEATENQTKEVKRKINTFNAISVREKSGVNLFNKYLDQQSVISLLDPTLLFNLDFYKKTYTGNEIDRKGKIGIYFLDNKQEYSSIIQKLEKETKLTSFTIGKQEIVKNKTSSSYYPSVSQWLKDFETSEFIITDSYHGAIFSIIFKKKFCVIGNKTRGLSRFESLLDSFNTQNVLFDIQNIEKFDLKALFLPIDNLQIESVLKHNLFNSDQFLKSVGI